MATSPMPTAADQGPLLGSRHRSGSRGRAAGYAASAILAVAGAVHAYWAVGGTWAAATAYGSADLPPRGVVAVVAALIAGAVLLILTRIGVLAVRLPARLLHWGPWALVAAFALAGINNLMAPADSYARDWHIFFFGPLLLSVAVLCALVARSPTGAARRG